MNLSDGISQWPSVASISGSRAASRLPSPPAVFLDVSPAGDVHAGVSAKALKACLLVIAVVALLSAAVSVAVSVNESKL